MGLFKDLKNMKDTAAEHGGMPSWKEARADMSAVFDDRGEREILKTGTAAMAKVAGMMMPVQGDRFAMQVPLEIHPPEGAPYTIQYVFTASRMQAPLSPGLEVPVKISKDDPQHVAVQWDAQKAAVAAAGGAMNAAMQGLASFGSNENRAQMMADSMAAGGVDPSLMNMQGIPGTPPIAAAPAAPAAAGNPVIDAQARLKQLEELKSGGLISDEEYQQKRTAILADL